MSDYIIYYTESNVVCLIIFAVILIHDLLSIDRQEKQIKYDHALVAFMSYFISDIFCAMVLDGVIAKTDFTFALSNFLNYFCMAAITYEWLLYVMAVEQIRGRNTRKRKLFILSPFLLSTLALAAVYLFARPLLFSEDYLLQPLYFVFLIAVPVIYIAAVLFHSVRKALHTSNPTEKRTCVQVGSLPLFVIAGGLLQVVFLPDTPVFCFCCAILMIIFNIKSMESSISIDPLTGLNNRGQLMRIISQKSPAEADGKHTFIAMIDVNDFKAVNDTYGHAQGDTALVIIADSMKKSLGGNSSTLFFGRYGGDEFILILQSETDLAIDAIIEDLRAEITAECKSKNTPYLLSISVGYDQLHGESDSFKNCIQRADSNMYLDKQIIKKSGRSTVIRRNA